MASVASVSRVVDIGVIQGIHDRHTIGASHCPVPSSSSPRSSSSSSNMSCHPSPHVPKSLQPKRSKIDFSIEAILARHPSPPLPLPLPMSIFQQSSKDPISRTDPNSPSQSSTNDPSQLHQLSWVHCTRYRPPKLPRVKRETAYRTRYRNPRIPFSTTEVAALENKFRSSPYLGSHDVVELATDLNMSPKRIKIWFQNRRARERRENDVQ